MYSRLDRELGERMFELARQMPFTNAASSRQALGEPLPGVPMGDCATQCNAHFTCHADALEVVYDDLSTQEVYWFQGGGKLRVVECLSGLGTQSQRQIFDHILRPIELNLPTVIDLLKSAPQWSEEFNRRTNVMH